jgi:hypothetical protein
MSLPPPPPQGGYPQPPHMPPQTLAYATPGMPRAVPGGFGVWRQGDRIVATREIDLGDGCVKCGAPSDGWRWNKTLWWHEPWLFVLIFFPGILIYAIVALILRKSAKVSCGLCPVHRKKRNNGIMIAWAIALVGVLSLVGGIMISSQKNGDWGVLLVIGGIVVALIAAVVGSSVARVLVPKKIDNNYAWYGGAGEPFLQTLPLTS